MPAQTNAPSTVFYVEGDTAPDLEVQLVDADGAGIPLTDAASASITIAPDRWSYYWSPVVPIVLNGTCVINPDQVTYPGYVTWTPGVDELSPAGNYEYRIKVTWNDGSDQTFPPNETLRLTIRAKVGGNV